MQTFLNDSANNFTNNILLSVINKHFFSILKCIYIILSYINIFHSKCLYRTIEVIIRENKSKIR